MHFHVKKTSIILTLGACAASLLGVADANASVWRHFPPNMCTAVNGYTAPAGNSSGQEYNPSTTASSQWTCPVVTDSSFPGSTATYVQLWGYQPYYNAVQAAECRTYYGGGGGACGSTFYSGSSTGTFALQWTPGSYNDGYSNAWTGANAADSLYVSVVVGSPSGGNYPVLFGYGFSQ